MTVFKHEMRQGKWSLIIWSSSIAIMMAICILIYPEMGNQMDEISKSFADMGSFSAAFGLDKLNFGEFSGYFGIECGNVLGLGGAFFAALLGISALAKEEKEHTAEFLFANPVSRTKIITEKLFAVFAQIVLLNVIVIAISTLCIIAIDTSVDAGIFALLFIGYLLMQIEIGAITFGISAFIKHGTLGIGLGLATVFYFINIIANLMDKTKFLKYFTPFGYTDGADIISDKSLNISYITVGAVALIIGIATAYIKYNKKDIL